MEFKEAFDLYLTGKQRREISITYHIHKSKLQAVKDLMEIRKTVPELGPYGLKDCKEYVESLPCLKEDPVLDLLDKIEEIERTIKDLPDLIIDAMPNMSIEQAKELSALPENFLSELKRRANVTSSGNRFGI